MRRLRFIVGALPAVLWIAPLCLWLGTAVPLLFYAIHLLMDYSVSFEKMPFYPYSSWVTRGWLLRFSDKSKEVVAFVHAFFEAGKPVAAICQAPWTLVEADVVKGRTLTCWPSIAVDVKNAGGRYVDKPVVEDGNLITSRKTDDLTHFTDALIRQLTSAR